MMSTNSSDDLLAKKLADLSVSSALNSASSPPRSSQVIRSMTDTTVLHCSAEQHSSIDSDEAIFGSTCDSDASQDGDSAKSDRIEEGDDEEGAKFFMTNNASRPRGFTHCCTRNDGDNEYAWMASPPEIPVSVEQPVDDVGWVASWATDFDILLADPIGLKAFTDFLCKEFSYENLQFFLAIQEFKKLDDGANQEKIRAQAQEIFEMYISNDATDPVNVDNKAKKAAEVGLEAMEINNQVFALPEKQIYNLMKFDSYQRFLKSDIFKECASLDLLGKSLPYESDSAVHNEPNETAATAGAEMKAECKSKRKSIIPWARIKSSLSNVKGASFSSMPNKESRFRRPMRKFASSLTKIRSKSFDEYMHHRVRLQVDGTGSKKGHVSAPEHSTSIDKTGCTKPSLNFTDSLDLSEHDNVFSQCDITKQIMPKSTVTPVKPQRAQPFLEKPNGVVGHVITKVNQTQSQATTQQSRPPLLSAINVSHKSLPSSMFHSLDHAHKHHAHHHSPNFVQCA